MSATRAERESTRASAGRRGRRQYRGRTVMVALTGLLLFALQPSAQDQLAAARDLYVSARYDEALALLERVKGAATPGPAETGSLEQYRALCFMALGRQPEAEAAIETFVRVDPLRHLTEEAPPRLRSLFGEVRSRLLPDLVMEAYVNAKQAFDAKQFGRASEQFRAVLGMLAQPELRDQGADLETLASGFLTLSVAGAAAEASPPPPAEPEVVKEPPVQDDPSRIYTYRDTDVSVPVVVKQQLPPFPRQFNVTVRAVGALGVLVNEQGRVESAVILEPVHPLYDSMIVKAAKDWVYQPATRAGVPVKFRKIVQVTVNVR